MIDDQTDFIVVQQMTAPAALAARRVAATAGTAALGDLVAVGRDTR